MTETIEANFDGLVGPTHNYAGLSLGNVASQKSAKQVSRPKEAARQGLSKMRHLMRQGFAQAVLPPHDRPDVAALRGLGFDCGDDAKVLAAAAAESPHLLAMCSSASPMWAANAATVSPSADASDGRVHFTAANLISQPHRAIEAQTTARILRSIFGDESYFAHHPPLPAASHFSDEGAANHMRVARGHSSQGVEIFVYGRDAFNPGRVGPAHFPARQSRAASEAIARSHRLDGNRAVFVQQHPTAVDAGVFHNDVIALANENVLLYHELSFADESDAMAEIFRAWFRLHSHHPLLTVRVSQKQLPVEDAVSSYLFNSQLLTRPDGGMLLLCPLECESNRQAKDVIEMIRNIDGNPVDDVQFVNVRESMRNGGGPACLRLRVVLSEAERNAVAPGVWLTEKLAAELEEWIDAHYRDELKPDDLGNTSLLRESRDALDALTQLLGLGDVYAFQR